MFQPNQPESQNTRQQKFESLVVLCRIVGFPLEICLVRFGTWGHRYLDFSSLLGFFWPLMFVGLHGPRADQRFTFLFLWVSILLLLTHRIVGFYRRHNGYHVHSRFQGESWFEQDYTSVKKRVAYEFRLVAFVSLVIGVINKPLGELFMIANVALVLNRWLLHMKIENRLQQIDDARIENECYAQLYRERFNWK